MRTTSIAVLAVVAVLVSCGADAPAIRHPPDPVPAPSRSFRRGVVVNHWLGSIAPSYLGQSGVPHTYAAPWFDAEDVTWIAAHGFDHIQMSVALSTWFGADGALDETKLAPFEHALRWAAAAGLGVVARLSEAPPVPGMDAARRLDFDDERVRNHHVAMWGRVASRFASVGDELRFQLPQFKLDPHLAPPDLDELIRRIVAEVRATSPKRFLYASPVVRGEHTVYADDDASFEHLADLHLPDDDRVGVALGYWEPEAFTFQTPDLRGVPFPGTVPDFRARVAPDHALYAASNTELTIAEVESDFDVLAQWQRGAGRGREISLNAFGVHDSAEPASTRRYLQTVTGIASRLGLAWVIYDYESGCAIRGPHGEPTVMYEGIGLAPRSKPVIAP